MTSSAPAAAKAKPLTDAFHLLVTCPSEEAQRQLYNQLTTQGHRCRVLTRLGTGEEVLTTDDTDEHG